MWLLHKTSSFKTSYIYKKKCQPDRQFLRPILAKLSKVSEKKKKKHKHSWTNTDAQWCHIFQTESSFQNPSLLQKLKTQKLKFETQFFFLTVSFWLRLMYDVFLIPTTNTFCFKLVFKMQTLSFAERTKMLVTWMLFQEQLRFLQHAFIGTMSLLSKLLLNIRFFMEVQKQWKQ